MAAKTTQLSILGLLIALIGAYFASDLRLADAPSTSETSPARASSAVVSHADIGFRSQKALDDHFAKHGREFGTIDRDEYLRLAQALRDAPIGSDVLEAVREDRVTSRFRRSRGEFVAFNPDLTLRTFFKPNDGEAYFRRQAERGDER